MCQNKKLENFLYSKQNMNFVNCVLLFTKYLCIYEHFYSEINTRILEGCWEQFPCSL